MNHIHYPAEWELDGPIIMALPHEKSDWANILDEVTDQYKRIIDALIKTGDRIWLLVPDIKWAEEKLGNISISGLTLIEVPTNDTWTRDYGPISVTKNGKKRLLDFGFNGWGLKFASDHDNLVNLHLAEAGFIPSDAYRNKRGFILEGGSIDTDGRGTILTTSKCLLSPNRNPEFTRQEINEYLCNQLGAEHILWLDYGSLDGDDTDSHIDTLCRMAPDNTILFTGCRDMDDPHFEELLKMRAQLTLMRNAEGEPYNLIELPLPRACYDEDGRRLPATYANYLVTKRAIYMPTYNDPHQDLLACQTVKIAFPDHKVVAVDCSTLIKQHGSLHCSTMGINEVI